MIANELLTLLLTDCRRRITVRAGSVASEKLFTIGYEGATPADFLATLRACGVLRVIDVRQVSISRKRGFSKSALSEILASEGIAYVHLKELGDPKPGREAARRGDFSAFRRIYGQHLKTREAQAGLRVAVDLAAEKASCLLCFERAAEHCHRTIVATAIAEQKGFKISHLVVQHGAGSPRKGDYDRSSDRELALG
jgi:uncharacterized protein (DUF488 family)